MPKPGRTTIVGAFACAVTRFVVEATRKGRIWPTTAEEMVESGGAGSGGEAEEVVEVEVSFEEEDAATRMGRRRWRCVLSAALDNFPRPFGTCLAAEALDVTRFIVREQRGQREKGLG